jgi:hypothetical protein
MLFTYGAGAGTGLAVVLVEPGTMPGKVVDAELHFSAGPLAGLRLIGFGVWERKTGSGRNVTFPARSYSVNGERRSFALLRPVEDSRAQDTIRDLILAAVAAWELSNAGAAEAERVAVVEARRVATEATRARALGSDVPARQALTQGAFVPADGLSFD